MRIEHLAIWSKDIERLRDFYQNYFGANANTRYHNPTKQFSSYFLTFGEEPTARLELMQMPGIPESRNDPLTQFTGLVHFAISVGSETQVDSLTQRLRQDGFQVLDGPRRTGDGYYESVILDPDNNRIEITA